MSAEPRLKKWAIKNKDTITIDKDVIFSNVEERIMNLVELVANVDEGCHRYHLFFSNIYQLLFDPF